MNRLFQLINTAFDTFEENWDSPRGQRRLGTMLVIAFLTALVFTELSRLDWLPAHIAEYIPQSHLMAIHFAFTLLLGLEVVSLILSLAHSVSTAVGKQFEILALILLRGVFKEISHLHEESLWQELYDVLLPISSSSIGALSVFIILGFYYREQKHKPIVTDGHDRISFITAKKLIALGLLFSFAGLIIWEIYDFIGQHHEIDPFESFYTILIFTDILIVLISLRYSASFHVSFRNSIFTVVTLFIRLALNAPPLPAALIAVATAVFAYAMTLAYNRFVPDLSPENSH
ncbi:MAG: hypothetical protein KDK39_07830 [Leptospiraceae bacterium]|nr:hypothetical protein [Leptospiraceae bacterium]